MIGIEKIILSSIGGAIFTLLIQQLIKSYEKQQNLKKQTKVFIDFIDSIIIRYLNTNIEQYESLITEIDNRGDLFKGREVTQSPMLNRKIFEFFDKDDLIKIFNYSKNFSIANVYHYFYEIDFLQENSPINLYDDYGDKMVEHFNIHKKENENLYDHAIWCDFSKRKKIHFRGQLAMQKKHTKELLEVFKSMKIELLSIDDLNYDED